MTAVDYLNKVVTLDPALPAGVAGAFFEVGTPERDGRAAHWTTFEAVKVEPAGNTTRLHWRKGADVFSGEITKIERRDDGVTEVTAFFKPNVIEGECAQLTATNESGTKMWRCDVAAKVGNRGDAALNGTLTLYGAPVGEDDLRVGERIRLFEIGMGDVWRTATSVSIERTAEGDYEVKSNVRCEVLVNGRPVKQ